MTSLRLRAAQGYARRGWRVLPIRPRDKRPLLPGWQDIASIDEDVIAGWFDRCPAVNVGIATGPASGLFVLDVDGATGEATLAGQPLPPDAPVVATGRGRHVYLAFPSTLASVATTKAGVAPGLDTRGRGGFVVAPPSRHPSSSTYGWLREPDGALPPAPAWLVRLLSPARSPIGDIETGRTIPGNYSAYTRAALDAEVRRIREAPQGARNSALNRAAFALGTLVEAGGIHPISIATALARAALDAGLPAAEVRRTLESGLAAGMARPREVAHG